jgi:NADP-dependent aldehyde dehydrogenase
MAQNTFQAINPKTGEALDPPFVEAADSDIRSAADEAGIVFSTVNRDRPPGWPAALLDAIAGRIMDLGDALLERAEAETALPRQRLIGERARTVGQLKMFSQIARDGSWVDATIDTADPTRTPAPRPDLRRMLRPRGPVAVFGASNFPFAFGAVGGDTASALAAGCSVVVKGHPSHPGTSDLFARAVADAIDDLKLDQGLFALLQGRDHAIGATLVKHPEITAVGFTGSLKAGRTLFDLAASRPQPIPVYAEMGSYNPIVILPEAMRSRGETIARDLAASILLGGGQFCTKPGVIFTAGDDRAFIDALSRAVSNAPAVTMLNQGLRENFDSRLARMADVRGVSPVMQGGSAGHANVTPTLLRTDTTTWLKSRELWDECFGPAALLVHCDEPSEFIACVEMVGGNLTGTIHFDAGDEEDARFLIERLSDRVGRVIVNGYPTGVEVNNAIVHGGPYPATTDPATTSVGSAAIRRWVRLQAYQDVPDTLLPPALQNKNPLGIERVVNGGRTREALS